MNVWTRLGSCMMVIWRLYEGFMKVAWKKEEQGTRNKQQGARSNPFEQADGAQADDDALVRLWPFVVAVVAVAAVAAVAAAVVVALVAVTCEVKG